MRIEIISTGDEVITGSTEDTNSSYLSRELIEAGLQVNRRHTTGDNLEELMSLFTEISSRNAIAICTGGLGPTTDDLTTEAIAKVAQVPLELNESWLERMRQWYESRGRVMAKANIKQAMLPKGSILIDNPMGTACGFAIKINHALFIFAPGVPREMKTMWDNTIKDMILSFTKDSTPRTHLIRLFLMGIGESDLTELLSPIQLPASVTIGDRAMYPLIELKIIGHDASNQEMISVLDAVMEKIKPYYVCRDKYSLIDILAQRGYKISKINAVDGLCRGVFLIRLQEITSSFISCMVLNTNEEEIGDEGKVTTEDLLSHTPEHNQIILMPREGSADPMVTGTPDNPFPHKYVLSYKLDVECDGKIRTISATLHMDFLQSVYLKGMYTRSRDFLAHLCCTQIYKHIVNEPFVYPTESKITVINQEG